MKISPSKLISLLFFIFSGYYLYTAYQIQVFAFDENAPFNAKTFPIYLGFAGLVFSSLYIILPEANPTNVDLKVLDYKKTIGLIILMILIPAIIGSKQLQINLNQDQHIKLFQQFLL